MNAPPSNTASHISTSKLFRLFFWVHWRMFVSRLKGLRQQSPLFLLVFAGFILGYLLIGYLLFRAGLNYLYHFPLVGGLLSQRILYLIFIFFFVMLIFSNVIVGYSTLFKNRETSWFLTLPIPHKDIYRWKFLECLLISSWALLFLSAPLMAAYGNVYGVPWSFYLQTVLGYIPFVIIPALLGSWGIVFLVRILAKPWVKKLLIFCSILSIASLVYFLKPVQSAEADAPLVEVSFEQLLRHTKMSLHPALPSAWLAKTLLSWSEGLYRESIFYLLALTSYSLFGLLIGYRGIGRLFYGSWSAAASSTAARFQARAHSKRIFQRHRTLLEWGFHLLPFINRPLKVLFLKDIRVFWRDPSQWIQFVIFFGLLCIYVLNLRNVAVDFNNPFWEAVISHLNLAASALTLSTLTTRFVFPQFSLEGRRFWILNLAPVGLQKIILQKFWLSSVVALVITVTLMIISCSILNLSLEKTLFFAGATALMSFSLSGLSVGLGAMFPNFKEENSSKIVSGFGGTLCLVVSFLYIALFISLLAIPAVAPFLGLRVPLTYFQGALIAFGFSVTILFIPLFGAFHRVKELEF